MPSQTKKMFDIMLPQRKEAKAPERKKNRAGKKKKRFSPIKAIGIVGVLGLVAGFIVLSVVFANARILLWPISRELTFHEQVRIQGNTESIDIAKKSVPAKLLTVEKSATKLYPATGIAERDVKAEGTIRVFNNQTKTQILIASTRFMSEQGKLFRSTTKVSIPAGSSLDLAVVAAEAGEEYNIEPSNFSLPGLAGSPLYTLIYGKSLQPMVGGAKSEAPVVTEEDIRDAENSLEQDLIALAKEEIKKREIAPFVVDEKTFDIQILESSSTVKAGAELAQFSASAKVKVTGLMFQLTHLQELLQEIMRSRLSEGEKLHAPSMHLSYNVRSFRPETQTLDLSVDGEVKAYQDTDVNQLTTKLQGATKNDAEGMLRSEATLSKFEIKLWPFWTRSIPNKLEKLHVRFLLD